MKDVAVNIDVVVDIDEEVAVAVDANADVDAEACISILVDVVLNGNPGVVILEGGVAGGEGGPAMHGGASPFQNVHAMEVCVSLDVKKMMYIYVYI